MKKIFYTSPNFALISILLMLIWQINAAEAQVITDGLISYWSFDKSDINGEIAMDIWGNNDGKILGEPKIVDGVVREALDFNGTTDAVDCGKDDSLNITKAMTIEFWIYPRENAENRHLISRGEWAAGGYWVQHGDPGNIGGLYFYLDGVYTAFIIPAGSSELEIWHHFLLTYDGTAVKGYKNGELINEAVASGDITAKEGSLMIARYMAVDLHHFDGIMDEARIYDRALNEDEVKQNFLSEGLAVVSNSSKITSTWGDIKFTKQILEHQSN